MLASQPGFGPLQLLLSQQNPGCDSGRSLPYPLLARARAGGDAPFGSSCPPECPIPFPVSFALLNPPVCPHACSTPSLSCSENAILRAAASACAAWQSRSRFLQEQPAPSGDINVPPAWQRLRTWSLWFPSSLGGWKGKIIQREALSLPSKCLLIKNRETTLAGKCSFVSNL